MGSILKLVIQRTFALRSGSIESFNRDPQEIAENSYMKGLARQTVDASADGCASLRGVFSNLRRGSRVMALTRAPLRKFLAKSARADFQEFPAGRG